MSKLQPTMDAFHNAILKKDAQLVAPAIRGDDRLSAQSRMAIYIDGYRIRLTLAIRSDYPTLLALLGDASFDAAARAYIESTPPAHFSLDRYPHGFADFFRANSEDVFAADIAALEAAIADVFMDEDSEPLSPQELASITPEAFGAVTLSPRKASRLMRFAYPVEDALLAVRDGKTPARPQAEASYMFLARHNNEVQRHVLSHAEYVLLTALTKRLPVGQSLESAAESHADLLPEIAGNLQTWFSRWAANGFFQSLKG